MCWWNGISLALGPAGAEPWGEPGVLRDATGPDTWQRETLIAVGGADRRVWVPGSPLGDLSPQEHAPSGRLLGLAGWLEPL